MLNRDSFVMWVGLGIAIVGYLLTAQKPPPEWSYQEWLQAGSFVLVYLSGKLASSPLPRSQAAVISEAAVAKTDAAIAKTDVT